MKIKTSELIGPALDWAVASVRGRDMYFDSDSEGPWFRDADTHPDGCNTDYGSWELCGPILEEHNITVERWDEEHEWKADQAEAFVQYGGTYLEAAMRCYVASKLGDEVDIPEELT